MRLGLRTAPAFCFAAPSDVTAGVLFWTLSWCWCHNGRLVTAIWSLDSQIWGRTLRQTILAIRGDFWPTAVTLAIRGDFWPRTVTFGHSLWLWPFVVTFGHSLWLWPIVVTFGQSWWLLANRCDRTLLYLYLENYSSDWHPVFNYWLRTLTSWWYSVLLIARTSVTDRIYS
jgi:hypothetical protein